jgi:hypothetical protein
MIKSMRSRALAAWVSLLMSNIAAAAGDSGTGSVGEMQLSASQFGMVLGGAVALGVAIWLVSKLLNR